MTPYAENLLARQTAPRLPRPRPPKPAPSKPTPLLPTSLSASPPEPTALPAPPTRLSISAAAKRHGVSRDAVYRLFRAGFVFGCQPGPKKILIDLASLKDFLSMSALPGFWTAECKAHYNGRKGAA